MFSPVHRLFDSKKACPVCAGRAFLLYGVQYPFKMFSASSAFAVSSSSACDLSMASMMLHRSVWYMGSSRQSASKSYSPDGLTVTESKGGIGRAVIGAAVAGPVGAIVGAATAKTETRNA